MSEISRSSIFRSKVKKEAEKNTTNKKNNVVVIFKTPEEEKKFSKITHRLNYGRDENR